MKKFTIIICSTLLAFTVASCSSKTTTNNVETNKEITEATEKTETSETSELDTAADSETVFTSETLATFDGKNGNKAYVAVDGVVYDASNSPKWKNGTHNGLEAGTDLSADLAKSPHGSSVLKKLPVVGTYSN